MGYTHKRAIFVGVAVFASHLIASVLNYDPTTVSICVAGIAGGVCVVLFPDPEHLRRLEQEKRENSDRS